jgi:predicted RNase H-like HicB family nuclease
MAAVIALIHGEPGAYGISFPDFVGCVSGGTSIDEALRRGREALLFHVDSMMEVGEALPRLREAAEIAADPSFAADFTGAILGVIDLDLPKRAVRVNISLDERLLDRADRAAQAFGETRSGYIAGALKQRLMGTPKEEFHRSARRSIPRVARKRRSKLKSADRTRA